MTTRKRPVGGTIYEEVAPRNGREPPEEKQFAMGIICHRCIGAVERASQEMRAAGKVRPPVTGRLALVVLCELCIHRMADANVAMAPLWADAMKQMRQVFGQPYKPTKKKARRSP